MVITCIILLSCLKIKWNDKNNSVNHYSSDIDSDYNG